MTLWNLKPSVQGVGWEKIQWCNFSNEVAEMRLEFWEIGDVLNSWDSRDGDALGQLWTKNFFKSADSGRLSFSIWTTWKIIIFCKLLFQPAVFLYTIWHFKFFFFICFSCALNCLLKHFYNGCFKILVRIPTSLSSWCWTPLVVFSHSTWDFPDSWYDEVLSFVSGTLWILCYETVDLI